MASHGITLSQIPGKLRLPSQPRKAERYARTHMHSRGRGHGQRALKRGGRKRQREKELCTIQGGATLFSCPLQASPAAISRRMRPGPAFRHGCGDDAPTWTYLHRASKKQKSTTRPSRVPSCIRRSILGCVDLFERSIFPVLKGIVHIATRSSSICLSNV